MRRCFLDPSLWRGFAGWGAVEAINSLAVDHDARAFVPPKEFCLTSPTIPAPLRSSKRSARRGARECIGADKLICVFIYAPALANARLPCSMNRPEQAAGHTSRDALIAHAHKSNIIGPTGTRGQWRRRAGGTAIETRTTGGAVLQTGSAQAKPSSSCGGGRDWRNNTPR